MAKNVLTVGRLREALKDVPDNLEVKLSSDTGVDQAKVKLSLKMHIARNMICRMAENLKMVPPALIILRSMPMIRVMPMRNTDKERGFMNNGVFKDISG